MTNRVLLVLILLATSAVDSMLAAGDACSLLTQKQVSDALGIPVAAGQPIYAPTSCQWMGKGKFATLTISQPRAGKGPVEQFNAAKATTLPGIMKEPISGVGDDAFYVGFSGAGRSGLGLSVKKGSASFEIRVYGFEVDQAKPVAKTLAQQVAGKF
jgi:hypothetical protein